MPLLETKPSVKLNQKRKNPLITIHVVPKYKTKLI